MKRTVTCLCLAAAILSGGCTVHQESDKDEVIECTTDEIVQNPSDYEDKTVRVTGVMPHSGIEDENGEMIYPLFTSDLSEYIVLHVDGDPLETKDQSGTYQGVIHLEDEMICLEAE
ncbi:MAG: hypothetical protein PUE44_09995 [Bulleidia sp.]|nr:hypothetical protein [Bulleidia sp.]HAW12913.1 hypothetical protein [Erysipelotrichaceae bacterium]